MIYIEEFAFYLPIKRSARMKHIFFEHFFLIMRLIKYFFLFWSMKNQHIFHGFSRPIFVYHVKYERYSLAIRSEYLRTNAAISQWFCIIHDRDYRMVEAVDAQRVDSLEPVYSISLLLREVFALQSIDALAVFPRRMFRWMRYRCIARCALRCVNPVCPNRVLHKCFHLHLEHQRYIRLKKELLLKYENLCWWIQT